MKTPRSYRVYFVTHAAGQRYTGTLMRRWDSFFDGPSPAAIGSSEEDVLRQLEVLLQTMAATGDDPPERYLWDESFETREIALAVHPQTSVKKRTVIGAKEIPLRLTYVWSEVPNGGYRVMLPRFGWWFVLEKLSIAHEVLRQAVSTQLLGESPRSIYDFRSDGEEYVREWSPRVLGRGASGGDEDDTGLLPTVSAIADELVEKAARGKLLPVVGDSEDFEQARWLLARKPLPSILLVGPPGTGKSTWVRRLARHLLTLRRAGGSARAPRLWATSADRIIAGMSYLGMWQERCLKILRELAHEGDWLYVDRLVEVLRPQPDGGSVMELFQDPLASGEVAVVAECTEPEYERCQRRFPALVECFQVVRVREPPLHQVAPLLALYAARKGPALTIHPAGFRRLVQHLSTFQRDTGFPGKGLRFLDRLYADAAPGPPRVLYPRDVSEAFARQTGLALELIADEGRGGDAALAAVLRRSVIGQDAACAVAARVLARFKAGLDDPERPCGTLLFVGPTGVGKTELARAIARFAFGDEERLVRVDMSEYMLPGSAQRLLEVGAGVRSLAQRVREQPLALVLLDEIEKAHPEVFDVLLGVLGEGRLTDSFGAVVDFRMTLVVMTSNLGVAEGAAVGFGEVAAGDFDRAVRQHFRPEFFNRVDHVVSFRALSRQDVLRIVDLEVQKAGARTGLVRRKLRLEVDAGARAVLAQLGWHPARGARPLKRVIEERVVAPLAALMARDPALRDRVVRVVAAGDAVELATGPSTPRG